MNITKLFDYSVPLTAAATVLSVAAIVVAGIGAYTAYDIKLSRDNVVVTGSAKESVVSDMARLVIVLDTRTGINNQQVGYTAIEGATEKISKYLKELGLDNFETPAISSYPSYTYLQYGEPIMNGFTVNRQMIIRSQDIEKVNELANNIAPLTGSGYNVTIQAVELTYSKLDEIRVSLLSEALRDAKARAEAIASESGREIGVLRSASSGVVQVLPQGGIEISDYGMYDTQSMNKEVMVTVRATFEL